MADRGRRSGEFGFFARRALILCVSCIAASAALSSWPLVASAAAQVDVGGDESSLSILGGCVEIRAGDRTLSVGDCPGSGGGEASDAPHGIENTLLEATAPEHTSSEMEDGESDEPETTELETTMPAPHGDREVGGEDANHCPDPPGEDEAVRATVARVVDGDTLQIENPIRVEGMEPVDSVRLIGVDSPELDGDDTAEPYAAEAAAFTKDALEGEVVRLVMGDEPMDSRGRLLAYVWASTPAEEAPRSSDSGAPGGAADTERTMNSETVGDEAFHLFNVALVEGGLAEVSLVQPNDEYATCFEEARDKAEGEGLGIHSDDSAGELPDPRKGNVPEEAVSEQYGSEDGASEDSSHEEPKGAEPDTEPEDAVSEQYVMPEVTVETVLETTTMVPEPPDGSDGEESPASEKTTVEYAPPESQVEEESAPAEPTATLEAPLSPSNEVVDEPGESAYVQEPESLPEEAAILSAPAEAPQTSPSASEQLSVLPDTGGFPSGWHSPGMLLTGLGMLVAGVSLRLALRAGALASDRRGK